MAIKGLTDQRENFFPRIAKIRLGVKRKGQSGDFPADTDHFVLTDCPEVAAVYGEAPKRLIVMFPSNDLESIFPTSLEAWKASSKRKDPSGAALNVLFCRSDGSTAIRLYVGARDVQGHEIVQKMDQDKRPTEGEMFELDCPYEQCPYYMNKGCREVGRLNVVLPEVSMAGVYQIETSSLYAFGNILDMLRDDPDGKRLGWVRQMTRSPEMPHGDFAWRVPFELVRKPVSTHPAHLKGKSIIKHVLDLRVIDNDEKMKGIKLKVPGWLNDARFLFGGSAPALPAIPKDMPEDLFPRNESQAALPAITVQATPVEPATVQADDEPPPLTDDDFFGPPTAAEPTPPPAQPERKEAEKGAQGGLYGEMTEFFKDF